MLAPHARDRHDPRAQPSHAPVRASHKYTWRPSLLAVGLLLAVAAPAVANAKRPTSSGVTTSTASSTTTTAHEKARGARSHAATGAKKKPATKPKSTKKHHSTTTTRPTTTLTTSSTVPLVSNGIPCWKLLLNEWYGGAITTIYPLPCYTQAIDHLPADISVYSSAKQDIQAAELAASEGKPAPKERGRLPTTGTGEVNPPKKKGGIAGFIQDITPGNP